MRLFVSVDLPSELSEAIADTQATFADTGLRLTDPTQAHITLKFLGDTDSERISEINEGVETAVAKRGVSAFDCTVGGVGVFPTLNSPSVVWAGVRDGKGKQELTELATAIEAELTTRGFSAADHEFTPHVTLGRVDGNETAIADVVSEIDPTVGTFQVEAVRLTESTLTDSGPEYETVSEYQL